MRIRLDRPTFFAATLSSMLVVGMVSGAWAQQTNDEGGSKSIPSAGNMNGGGMPQVEHQGDVEFVTGGVGLDEQHAMRAARHQWPLSLRFIGPTSNYLSDVHVSIANSKNAEVLNATSRGPYMLVRLRPGRYTVHVSYQSREQRRAVTVRARGSVDSAFHWSR